VLPETAKGMYLKHN